MVQITPEEVMERRKRQAGDDPLTQFDKDIIGGTCRLEIPFRDVYRMRQTADLLRGYADLLDFYSRRTDLPQRAILVHLQWEAKLLNRKIKDTRGAGRPKKVYDIDEHNP